MPGQTPDMAAPAGHKRAAAGLQPRGFRCKQLVPEGKAVSVRSVPSGSSEAAVLQAHGLEGQRILRREIGGEDGGAKLAVIVPWTPEEFVELAVKANHPVDSMPDLDCDLMSNFDAYLVSPVSVVKERFHQMAKLSARAKELAADNAALLAKCDTRVAKILEGKNILLLAELLQGISHPDSSLVSEILAGTSLTGLHSKSFIFPEAPSKPMIGEAELRSASRWLTLMVVSSTTSSGNSDMDSAIWEETMAEQKVGWLEGPFSHPELDRLFPQGWLPAKRFGILQGGTKLRVIDDYSLPQINAAFSVSEKLTLDDVDAVAGLAKMMLMKAEARGESLELLGRTLDLKAAYRQLALAPSCSWCSIICVWNPLASERAFFRQNSLPFGGCASVYIFNR